MGRHALSLGKIFGIQINIDWSWIIIFGLVTWLLASAYFPSEYKTWSTAEYWIVGAVTSLFFFASVLLHELAHSIVAIRYGLTVKSITLFIFGGVSQINEEPPSAWSETVIAFVGPATSIVLAGVFYGISLGTTSYAPVRAATMYLAYINLILGIFNLIPGFPLDGGRVLRGILWGTTKSLRRATLIAANVGRGIAFLFIIFGVYLLFTGNFINGIWIMFIGWFLESAASSQLQQQQIHELLAGHKVSQAMNRNFVTIPENITLQNLLDEHIITSGRRSFIVERGDEMVGLLTIHQIRETPAEKRSGMTVGQAMITMDKTKKVTPSTELVDAMSEMDDAGVNQMPVMSDGTIVGVLSREDLISYLKTLRELDR
jgi:Zn-dependent protease/CBS domain-containing protein